MTARRPNPLRSIAARFGRALRTDGDSGPREACALAADIDSNQPVKQPVKEADNEQVKQLDDQTVEQAITTRAGDAQQMVQHQQQVS